MAEENVKKPACYSFPTELQCPLCKGPDTRSLAPAWQQLPGGPGKQLSQGWRCMNHGCRHAWSVPPTALSLAEAEDFLTGDEHAVLMI